MADVVFDGVSKVFGDGTRAVDKLSLDIADGEFMVLVGPSGCGKTTALRMVGGLEEITEGSVRIGERIVNDLSPKSRDIAMVFQSYALYPHLSVAGQHGVRAEDEAGCRRTRSAGGCSRPRGCSIWSRTSSASRARCRAGSASALRWGGRSSASRRPS